MSDEYKPQDRPLSAPKVNLSEDFRAVRNGMGQADLRRRAALDRIEEQYESLKEHALIFENDNQRLLEQYEGATRERDELENHRRDTEEVVVRQQTKITGLLEQLKVCRERYDELKIAKNEQRDELEEQYETLREAAEAAYRETERASDVRASRYTIIGNVHLILGDALAKLGVSFPATTPPCPYCGMTAQVEPSRKEPGKWMCHGCADTFPASERP